MPKQGMRGSGVYDPSGYLECRELLWHRGVTGLKCLFLDDMHVNGGELHDIFSEFAKG